MQFVLDLGLYNLYTYPVVFLRAKATTAFSAS